MSGLNRSRASESPLSHTLGQTQPQHPSLTISLPKIHSEFRHLYSDLVAPKYTYIYRQMYAHGLAQASFMHTCMDTGVHLNT